MNNYKFLSLIVALFNYFIVNVLAENSYYAITIRRNEKDEAYDKAPEKLKDAIDELVNDRMNDIYDIITNYKGTYINSLGVKDKLLNEIDENSKLLKRNSEKSKFRFINKNRPERNKREFGKRSHNPIEYIPISSDLIKHICPVSNYYVIVAYLSDDVVEKVRKLPNVIRCTKEITLEVFDKIKREDETNEEDESKEKKEKQQEKYYDINAIKAETGWKNVSVQERKHSTGLLYSHLSPLSQGYYVDSNTVYDNNYYYPESAGKGIDVYIIDEGFNAKYDEETIADFDTYEGTDDERTIQCDGIFSKGEHYTGKGPQECEMEGTSDQYHHGTLVAMTAVGAIHGAAKKANLHMLVCDLQHVNILAALDYVLVNAKPHKTIVNLSLGCGSDTPDEQCISTEIQEKILELVNNGIIIVAAAGNDGRDRCNTNIFEGADGVLAIGAISDDVIEYTNPQEMYRKATYSNFGKCIFGFAPGSLRTPKLNLLYGETGATGTSFSSPLVAGVIATIMSDDTETKYTFAKISQKLKSLSIKNILKDLPPGTTNNLINNGKKSIYVPPKCNDPSRKYHCGDQCCTKYGVCADYNIYEERPACLIENNQCVAEYGRKCDTKLCGKYNNDRHCDEGECCSATGYCIEVLRDPNLKCFAENKCNTDYGDKCLSYNLDNINDYKKEYQDIIYNLHCSEETTTVTQNCLFYESLYSGFISDANIQEQTCKLYRNSNCDTFFENPQELFPSCSKVNKTFEFKSYFLMLKQFIKGAEKIFCAMKPNGEFCFKDNMFLIDESSILNQSSLQKYCPYNECTESLKIYIEGLQELYSQRMNAVRNLSDEESLEEAEYYKIVLKKIPEILKMLNNCDAESTEENQKTSDSVEDTNVNSETSNTNNNNDGKSGATSIYPRFISYLIGICLILFLI